MNGEITFCGIHENLMCTGVRVHRAGAWDEIHIDRLEVPHMLHLLRIQGLPIASIFSGELRYGKRTLDLTGWMLAKCSYPKLWEVPHYLRKIVLVKGDDKEQTMLACVGVHKKKLD